MTQANPAAPAAGGPHDDAPAQMTHRQILEALSGLLLAMFVAMLSSTVVSNALPRIVADLDGSQTGYTWVVVATMLAMTATTPIWGKLADLFSQKMLVQVSLVIYMAGSLVAALAPSMEVLITARVIQGLGVGGLTALVQVVIATMIPPRERGRYAGYLGAVFALATVSGPLIGGLIVDSPMGWRGCFFIGLPIAAAAFVLLQKTLHLPVIKRPVSIDYLGATLIAASVSTLLIWVSLAGSQFAWGSALSIGLVALGLVLLAAAIWVESRAAEPIIPLHLFKDRTITLATIASTMVGVAMFGSTVYLSQYFQTARGMSPTNAGLMSIAMVGGLFVSSIVSGRIITATGRWKGFLVGGMVLIVTGLGLLGTIDETTSLVVIGVFMAVLGVGMGATMQNLVLAVQNNVPLSQLGTASAVVAFFRSMGGSIGVSALGALLGHQVAAKVTDGMQTLGIPTTSHETHAIPDLATLPAPVREVFESAFGQSFGELFLVGTPFAVIALVCVALIKEVPLRTSNLEEFAEASPEVAAELHPQVVEAGEARR